MNAPASNPTDVVLIGAGIMSATLAVMLKELNPALKIAHLRAARGPCGGKFQRL